jgi:hypothetical protein
MMMLEDLGLALRNICRAIGLSGDAATIVSVVVLGTALNIAALHVVSYVGLGRHARHEHTALRSAAQSELKVVRTVVVTTIKKIGNRSRSWCLAQQRKSDETKDHHVDANRDWTAPADGDTCEVMVAGRSGPKLAVALVQC